MQGIDDEQERLCREYERQKEAKLSELKAAEEHHQMLQNKDVSVTAMLKCVNK